MKLLLYIVSFIAVIASSAFVHAQAPEWQWAKTIGSTQNDYATKIVSDKYGNIFVAGNLSSPGIFENDTTTLGSGGFLARLNETGQLIWLKYFPNENTYDVVADDSDHIYLLSYGILRKFNLLGDTVWTERLGGLVGFALSVDKRSDIIITGRFNGTAYLGTNFLLTSTTGSIFIAKYAHNKTFLWAKAAGGSWYDATYGVTTDKDFDSYITGYFKNSALFDTIAIPSNGNVDRPFVAKYDGAGNVMWAKPYDGIVALSIASDNDNHIFITGNYQDTLHTARRPGKYSNQSTFLSQLDTNGNVLWSKNVGGPCAGFVTSIAIDNAGNSYVGSDFRDTVFFDSTPYNIIGNRRAGFVTKYDPQGSVGWVKITDTSGGIISICVSKQTEDLFTTGAYGSKGRYGNTTLSSKGMEDIFIAKLSYQPNAINVINTNSNDLLLYPQPTTGKVNIQFNNTTFNHLTITDQLGRQVQVESISPHSKQLEIDLYHLPSGIYYAQFTGCNTGITRKILVQH